MARLLGSSLGLFNLSLSLAWSLLPAFPIAIVPSQCLSGVGILYSSFLGTLDQVLDQICVDWGFHETALGFIGF